MLDILKKYQVFIAVFLFLISKQLLKYHLAVNEADLLPVAKHFMNPDWIKGDWYLDSNLAGNYRYLFNVIFGAISNVVPLGTISILGRLLILTVFSFFVHKIAGYFKLSFWFIIPFLFLYTNNHSIGAREWIINGIEAKSIAYAFVLLAFLTWMKRFYKAFLLCLGLATSFHVLVGAYATLTFIIAMLLNWNYFKTHLVDIIKNSWIGIVSGGFGIYAIAQFLFNTELSFDPDPDLIYVLVRVPHHLLPSTWDPVDSIVYGVSSLIIFVVVIWRSRNHTLKLICSFALASYVFMVIGFLIYFSGNFKALKYYWFRFPDAIVPLFAFVLVIPILINLGVEKLNTVWRKVFNGIFIIGSIALYIIFFGTIFPKKVQEQFASKPASAVHLDDDLVEICAWIKANTDPSDQFLIDPYFSEFYLLSERPVIVSVKHFPQTSAYVFEWYNRLNDIYGYKLPLEAINDHESELLQNYIDMPIERAKYLKEKYGVKYMLNKKKREDSLLPLVINKGIYSLYRLD